MAALLTDGRIVYHESLKCLELVSAAELTSIYKTPNTKLALVWLNDLSFGRCVCVCEIESVCVSVR